MRLERETVAALLDGANVLAQSALFVHSAFRQLSRAGHSAEAFCEALLERMAGGTLLMPTMTWRTVNADNPVFDEMATPSHTGVLTEIFRTRYATHRSLHASHSVAGTGPLAGFLLSTHHHGTTPCPASSPYGLVRDYDSYTLLLGVGMDCCTAIHHAEEMVAPDFYVRPLAEAEPYTLVDRHGTAHQVLSRRHPRLPRDFPKFIPRLRAAGALHEGTIHGTPWFLFATRDLYRVVFRALVERPDAILQDVQ